MNGDSSSVPPPEGLPIQLTQVTVHRVDATDRICYIDDGFRQAAGEAGVPQLAEDVVGTWLFSAFAGYEAKLWYMVLLDHVRRWGAASVPFRCDTPVLKRWMTMKMTSMPQGGIEFTSQLMQEEGRAKVDFLSWQGKRSLSMVVMCGWCKRIRSVIGWLEIEEAVNTLQVFKEAVPPSIEYGICDEDFSRILSVLNFRESSNPYE